MVNFLLNATITVLVYQNYGQKSRFNPSYYPPTYTLV